jgi:UDP-glucose 4-epimerase
MPLLDMKTNILGTLTLLEAARKADVEHFIFSSSSAVYGDTLKVPVSEDIVPMPKSPYGVGKHTCEHYCRVYHTLYGMKTVSLRYFNVYGERQDPTSPYSAVVARFLHNARRNVPLEIHGSGSQIRDFIYVKDVVEANLCAMKSSQWGISLNIGTGKSVSILTLARAILKIRDVGIVHRNEREGDIRVSVADTRLAKKILGFTAKTRLADGLSRLWVHGD